MPPPSPSATSSRPGTPSRWPASIRRSTSTSRARGPQVHLVDGHTRRIAWPANEAYAASTAAGDVVLLLGIEPQLRWRGFTHQVAAIAEETDARLVVTLGALLADVVHRHPVSLIGTATDQAADRPLRAPAQPLRGADRHRGRAPRHLPAAGPGLALAVGGGAGLRLAGDVPQGRAGARRGGVRRGRGALPRRRAGRGDRGLRGADRRVPGPGRRAGRLRPPPGAHRRRRGRRRRGRGRRRAGRIQHQPLDATVDAEQMVEDIERFLRDQGGG